MRFSSPEPTRVNKQWPANPFAEETIAHEMHTFICENLEYMGALGKFDAPHIEAFAECYQAMKTSYAELEKEGFTVMDDKGRASTHPAFRVWSAATDKVRSFGNDMGCNYASRCRLASAEPPPENPTEAKKGSYFG